MVHYLLYRVGELSGISGEEFVNIKATLHSIENEEYQCGKCKAKDTTGRRRELKGCFEPKARHFVGSQGNPRKLEFNLNNTN